MIRKKRLQLVQTTNLLINRVFREFAARQAGITGAKRKPVQKVPTPSRSFRLFFGGKR